MYFYATQLLSLAVLFPGLLARPQDAEKSPTVTGALPQPTGTRSIEIFMSEYKDSADDHQQWTFFQSNLGSSNLGCDSDNDVTVESGMKLEPEEGSSNPRFAEQKDINNPIFPGGTFKFNLFGRDCQYMCNGSNTGRLFCPNFPSEDHSVDCTDNIGKDSSSPPVSCGSNLFRGVVSCAWQE